jgi:hypothetical protein
VIDEADRLLTQHYQDWTRRVFAAVYSPNVGSLRDHHDGYMLTHCSHPFAFVKPMSLYLYSRLIVDDTCTRSRLAHPSTQVPVW